MKKLKIILAIVISLIMVLLLAIVVELYSKNCSDIIENVSGDNSLSGDNNINVLKHEATVKDADRNIIYNHDNVIVEAGQMDEDSEWHYMEQPEVIITKNDDVTLFEYYGVAKDVYVNGDVVSIIFDDITPEAGYISYSVRNYSIKDMKELSNEDIASLKNEDLEKLYSDILSIVRENSVTDEEYDICKKLLEKYDLYGKVWEWDESVPEIPYEEVPEKYRIYQIGTTHACKQAVESYEDSTNNIRSNAQLYLDDNGDISVIINYQDPLFVAGVAGIKQIAYTPITNKIEKMKNFF